MDIMTYTVIKLPYRLIEDLNHNSTSSTKIQWIQVIQSNLVFPIFKDLLVIIEPSI